MEIIEANVKELIEFTSKLNKACDELNTDLDIISVLNHKAEADFSKGVIKTQHFVLSDFIFLFEKLEAKKNLNADFILAYVYDVLRNNHFANVEDLGSINTLISAPEFQKTIENISANNRITKIQKDDNPYFCFDIFQRKHDEFFGFYQFILDKCFNLQIENIQKFADNLHIKLRESTKVIPEDDSLEKTLTELQELIGLKEVKKNVEDLINYLKVSKIRTSEGLKNVDITLHTVFFGPPGTGKTTIARLLGRIFKHLGFLSKGQLYETDREGLVAGYVGQTAIKVEKVINESIGGVLFIDEAYALTQGLSLNDFGSEAINVLLKRMEDQREDLAVVVAGYTEPMSEFINSNPGLRSRFNRYFYFDHFKPNELLEIFELFCKKSDFLLTEIAKEKLLETFEMLCEKKDESFGNARVVRNLFEQCVQNQANRIVKAKKISKKLLKTFEEEDIPEPNQTLRLVNILN
ncbi:MAG: AAA family ATPase [Leadbetterella sp.]|nr:AAA family ATPase [Leadbetterella sp.]